MIHIDILLWNPIKMTKIADRIVKLIFIQL